MPTQGLINASKSLAKRVLSPLPWPIQDAFYFYRSNGRFPSIKRPRTFSEKVLHRKHYGNQPVYSELADKFLARQFVANRIGEQYSTPLLFETCDPERLLEMAEWTNIVIKPNHGAGMVKLIGDRTPTPAEKRSIIDECKKWLSLDFSEVAREIHYKSIRRRILVERLLGDGLTPPTDYKFHCFRNQDNQLDYVLLVINDRFSEAPSRGYYLNALDNCVVAYGGGNHAIPEEHLPLLQQAIRMNPLLAADFDYVRVDWYVDSAKLYFGELTFTPGAGLDNPFGEALETIMGGMWRQT